MKVETSWPISTNCSIRFPPRRLRARSGVDERRGEQRHPDAGSGARRRSAAERRTTPTSASEIESAANNHAASGLLDGGVSVDQVDEADGREAVAKIFGGNDTGQVASALAGGGAGNSDLIKKLLPILAPIVLAYIGKQLDEGVGAQPHAASPAAAVSATSWAASSAAAAAAAATTRSAASSAACSAATRVADSATSSEACSAAGSSACICVK